MFDVSINIKVFSIIAKIFIIYTDYETKWNLSIKMIFL